MIPTSGRFIDKNNKKIAIYKLLLSGAGFLPAR
jgi:hypothetical protein